MRGGCWPARSQRALTSSTCARGRREAGKGNGGVCTRKRARRGGHVRPPAYARVPGSPSQVVHVAPCTIVQPLSLTIFFCHEFLQLKIWMLINHFSKENWEFKHTNTSYILNQWHLNYKEICIQTLLNYTIQVYSSMVNNRLLLVWPNLDQSATCLVLGYLIKIKIKRLEIWFGWGWLLCFGLSGDTAMIMFLIKWKLTLLCR